MKRLVTILASFVLGAVIFKIVISITSSCPCGFEPSWDGGCQPIFGGVPCGHDGSGGVGDSSGNPPPQGAAGSVSGGVSSSNSADTASIYCYYHVTDISFDKPSQTVYITVEFYTQPLVVNPKGQGPRVRIAILQNNCVSIAGTAQAAAPYKYTFVIPLRDPARLPAGLSYNGNPSACGIGEATKVTAYPDQAPANLPSLRVPNSPMIHHDPQECGLSKVFQ